MCLFRTIMAEMCNSVSTNLGSASLIFTEISMPVGKVVGPIK